MLMATLGILILAARAEAQGPIEVGGGLAFAALVKSGDFWGDGLQDVGAEAHATLPLTPRFGLDLSTTFGRRNSRPQGYANARIDGGEVQWTEGFYAISIRQRIGPPMPGIYGFATYGLAGLFSMRSTAPIRETYPNGNVYTYPGTTYSRRIAPSFPIVGGGFQKTLAPHLALRADANVVLAFFFLPAGFRASATAVVPLGRWTTNP
jgi:hypothetical protein